MTPVSAAEFESLMAPLGPFDPGRRVLAGVSGGADSMALAFLLRRWGDPVAHVVDHGLRPGSAAEAAATAARLAAIGVPAAVTHLVLPPGPDLGARARAARYAALFAACTATGRPDLLVAHHARDQDETVLLRARAGSGPAGLAGMPRLSWRGPARLLRPLLGIPPARLRATLRAAGLSWVEDPGNHDPATARGALRTAPIPRAAPLGPARAAAEAALAAELAAHVTLDPAGHATLGGPLSPAAWSALVWTLSGRAHPPPPAAVERLRDRAGGTLAGVQRRGPLLWREPAALAPPVPACAGANWDGRFLLRNGVDGLDGATLGALGDDAARFRRRSTLPASVLRTLPAIRQGGKLLAVPHLSYAASESCRSLRIEFRPQRPLAAAPFGF